MTSHTTVAGTAISRECSIIKAAPSHCHLPAGRSAAGPAARDSWERPSSNTKHYHGSIGTCYGPVSCSVLLGRASETSERMAYTASNPAPIAAMINDGGAIATAAHQAKRRA
jgi:hypothetical protein